MYVWDVLGKRRASDELEVVGGVTAPDAELALILARETHFRHKEAVEYAVRRRGQTELQTGPYGSDVIGGVTDRSYRRQEAYAGVGAKLKRIAADVAKRGLRLDNARPAVGRARADHHEALEPAPEGLPSSGTNLSSEGPAAQGAAG